MSSSAIKAGRAAIEVFLDDQKLAAGLRGLGAKLRAGGTAIAAAGGAAVAGAGAVLGSLGAAVATFANQGDQLSKMSDRTGAAVAGLSELAYAAGQSDVSMEALEGGINKMNRTLGEAAGGSDTAAAALAGVGVSIADLQGLDPGDQFAAIAGKIGAIEDPARRTKVAMEVFGKGAAGLMPLMRSGAAGIEELRQRARDLGLTMSGADAAAATQLGDLWADLRSQALRAASSIGASLAPTLIGLMEAIIPNVSAAIKWIDANRGLVVMAAKIAVAVGLAGGVLIGLGGALAVAGFALSGLATLVPIVSTVLAAIASPAGLAVAAISAVAAAGIYLARNFTLAEMLGWLKSAGTAAIAFAQRFSFAAIVANLKTAGAAVADFFQPLTDLGKFLGGELLGAIGEVGGKLAEAFQFTPAISTAGVLGPLRAVGETIGGWLSGGISAAAEFGGELLGLGRDVLGMAGSFGFVRTAVAGVQSGTAALIGTIGRLGVVAGRGFAFATRLDTIAEAFRTAGAAVAEFFSPVADLGAYLGGEFMALIADLGAVLGDTFAGVRDAILAGDWQAAGEVAMAGLNAAWLAGVARLTQVWTDFKVAIIEAFGGAMIAVAQLWRDTLGKLARGLIDLASQEGLVGAAARKLIGADPRQDKELREKGIRQQQDAIAINRQERAAAVKRGAGADELARLDAGFANMQKRLAEIQDGGVFGNFAEETKASIDQALATAQEQTADYWSGLAAASKEAGDQAIAAAEANAAAARAGLAARTERAARTLDDQRLRDAAAAARKKAEAGDKVRAGTEIAKNLDSAGGFAGFRLAQQFGAATEIPKQQLEEQKRTRRLMEKIEINTQKTLEPIAYA